MRVLHVSGPARGGIARHIEQLCGGLSPAGVEGRLVSVVVSPASLLSLTREIRRGRWDLVHCHGFQGGAVGRTAAALAGVPAILTIHNTLQISAPVRLGAKVTEKWLAGRTARWVAVSAYLRNYARQELGVPPEKMETILNGVDFPPEIPPRQERPVLGTVARLIPAKGVDVFLRAVQLLRPEIPELKALVVGEGPEGARLRTMSRDLGLESIVEFLGYREDVAEQLGRMAVFVLPTRSEGLGISVLEAMARGVPVIASAVGGVPELVRHQVTGLLVRPGEYGAIARGARRLLADREGAETLRKNAYREVAANFSARAMLEQTAATYRRVLHA